VALLQQDFLIYGYHSAHYAQTVCGNSVEIPWTKPKRRKLRSAAPVQTGLLEEAGEMLPRSHLKPRPLSHSVLLPDTQYHRSFHFDKTQLACFKKEILLQCFVSLREFPERYKHAL
jgi:hypothetical protein